MQKLPGSTPRVLKPHPPTKLAPPGIRSRLVHMKRGEGLSQRTSPQSAHHNGVTNGYTAEFHEQGQPHSEQNARIPRSQQSKSREGARNSNGRGGSESSDRSSSDAVQYIHNQQRRGSHQRYSIPYAASRQFDPSAVLSLFLPLFSCFPFFLKFFMQWWLYNKCICRYKWAESVTASMPALYLSSPFSLQGLSREQLVREFSSPST